MLPNAIVYFVHLIVVMVTLVVITPFVVINIVYNFVVVVVSLFLFVVFFEFAVFVTSLKGGFALLAKCTVIAVEEVVTAFIVSFIVVGFGAAGFVFVVGRSEAFFGMAFLVVFVFFFVFTVFTWNLRRSVTISEMKYYI